MKFKFIGNGDNDPSEITVKGVTFQAGKATAVPNELADHFASHSHFAEVKGRKNDKDKS